MRYILPILFVFLLAGGTYRLFKGSPEPPLGFGPIIAFGDSLTRGAGATPGHDYVSLLSAAAGKEILNAGQSGDTTSDALARLDRDVLSRHPSLILVLLGGNDVLQGVPVAETLENMRVVVSRARLSGAKVLLLGLGPVGREPGRLAEGLELAARENGARYLPDILSGILGNPSLMSDEIHPNDTGYAILAERVRPEFLKMTGH